MPIIYNYTEEELIRMYIEFSKELKKKNGASISDFYKYAKSHDMPSFKYLMGKFKSIKILRKKGVRLIFHLTTKIPMKLLVR